MGTLKRKQFYKWSKLFKQQVYSTTYNKTKCKWKYFIMKEQLYNATTTKAYLCYKMITSQNVSSEAQVKNFFNL